MQPRRGFNLNASGSGSSYWGAKPAKKPPNLEKINEDYDKLDKSPAAATVTHQGSSRSEENKFSKYKLTTLEQNRQVKFAIGSSKSDENDYAKSYLVKEKELQDKQRQKNLLKQMELKQSGARNFLTDSNDPNQAKPPLPISKPNKEANKIKLFEKPMNLPLDISNPTSETYRVPAKKTSKSLETNLDKIEINQPQPAGSLTYRVGNDVKKQEPKPDADNITTTTSTTKQINKDKPKAPLVSHDPKPAKTYQGIHIRNNKSNPNENYKGEEQALEILPLEVDEANIEIEIDAATEAFKSSNDNLNDAEPNTVKHVEVEEPKALDKVEPDKEDPKQHVKRLATPNPKKMKLAETKKALKLTTKPEVQNLEEEINNEILPAKESNAELQATSSQMFSQPQIKLSKKLNESSVAEASHQQVVHKVVNEITTNQKRASHGSEPLKDADTTSEAKPNQIRMKKVSTPRGRPNEATRPTNRPQIQTNVNKSQQVASSNDAVSALFRANNQNEDLNENPIVKSELKVNPSIKSTKSGKRNLVIPNNDEISVLKQDQVKKGESFKTGNKIADAQALKTNLNTKRTTRQALAFVDTHLAPSNDQAMPDNADFAYKKLNEPRNVTVNMNEEEVDVHKLRNDSFVEIRSVESSMTPIQNDDFRVREISIVVVASDDTQPINQAKQAEEEEEEIEEIMSPSPQANKKIKEPKIEKPKTPKYLSQNYVKRMHVLSVILAFVFPCTGLIGLYYSHKTNKHFEMKDTENTRKTLNKLEWTLIGTLFLSLVFFIGLFALLALFLKWVTLF